MILTWMALKRHRDSFCPREDTEDRSSFATFISRMTMWYFWRCPVGYILMQNMCFLLHWIYWEGWFINRKTTLWISFFQNKPKGSSMQCNAELDTGLACWHHAVIILIQTSGWNSYIPAPTSAIFHTSSSNHLQSGCQNIPAIDVPVAARE